MRTRWRKTVSWLALAVAMVGLAACTGDPDSPATDAAGPPPPPEPRPAELVPAEARWSELSQGYVYTDSPAVSAAGELYFAAPFQNRIYRVTAAGAIEVFAENTAMGMGLMFGADGRLYACSNRAASIVAYNAAGQRTVLYQGALTPLPDQPKAPGEFCNDLAVRSDGGLWYTDRVNERVMYLSPDGAVSIAAAGFRPNGAVLSLDEQLLAVTDSNEPLLRAFAVQPDGGLTELPDYFPPVKTLEKLGRENVAGRPGTNGLTVDAAGRFYLTSFYGVQIFAPDGGYIGVIDKPAAFISNLTFAGPGRTRLVATGVNGLWELPMNVSGPPLPAAPAAAAVQSE
ncbi:MAG: SMP-30/gluconolactonase/LRE family protein [Gammaproteobacteria bacterium]|jgi:gluconolactonase|nr:SMP-30/gluconolactonase/LRE family protein [Gammaproteobacteria bacterium]